MPSRKGGKRGSEERLEMEEDCIALEQKERMVRSETDEE